MEMGQAVEETRMRLSSLIRQKGLTGGGGGRDCYWVLLAESSTDRFVTLTGVHESCWIDARNHEFQLVAVGSAASDDDCAVFWPGAKDLACVVNKIMRKNRYIHSKISEEFARRGLLIYDLNGRFILPLEQVELLVSDFRELEMEMRMWEMDMQMLSRVLKPPSVLGAVASPPQYLAALLVSLGRIQNHSEAAGYADELPELVVYSPFGTRIHRFSGGGDNTNIIMTTTSDGNNAGGYSVRNLLQELVAAAPRHVFTRSSRGGGGGNGGAVVPAAAVEFLVRRSWRDYDLEAQRHLDYDLEAAGGQGHRAAPAAAAAADGARRRAGRAAAPVPEPTEAAIEGVMVQSYAAFLPVCVTAYPLLKDVPDHIKLTIFGGLAFTTVGLFGGILSRTVARRRLAMRLASFFAITVLTFSVASQLSSPTFIALTAVVGVVVNLIIMLLQ